jgi:predicted unusual protein kinase regulating ubiquinone biosynthesis (AarF/ABC1/UbiB family)
VTAFRTAIPSTASGRVLGAFAHFAAAQCALGFAAFVLLRRARAVLLLSSVFAAYSWQWLVWRASGRRLWDARWQRVHSGSAQRLASGFARLGGVFIKLGQVMSVLGAYLPAAYAQALEPLQDSVPPRPFSEILPALRRAWGGTGLEPFSEFEQTPLAAASLAQVHRARLRDGTLVAVKVLYPNIHELIKADLAVIRWALPVVHRVFGFRRMHTVVDQLARMLSQEVDCTRERLNIERLAAILEGRPRVVVPKVFPELCRPWVLVMSFEEGIKLTSANDLVASGQDPVVIANTLVEVYLSLLLERQLIHADPHPGNLLARNNELVILDYGAVMDLTPSLVSGLKKVILGGLARNPDQVLVGVEEMGFVAEGGDRELLDRVGREYLAALANLEIKNFAKLDTAQLKRLGGVEQMRGRLRQIAGSVVYPEGYFYLERALVLLFALVGRLVPDKGLLGIAAPHASRALMRSFARKAEAHSNAES